MRFCNHLLQRFFTSSRSKAVSKGAKSDLNFKEGNVLPNPYDIIDRNVPGIQKRLSLLEMRRLREQLELDQADFDSLKSLNFSLSIDKRNINILNPELKGIELSYEILSNFPGLNCPSDASFDSSVTLRVPLDSLKLSEPETKKLMNFVKIAPNSKDLEFTVSDFPLTSQNKCRAIKLFNALIGFIKNQEAPLYVNEKISKSDIRKPRATNHFKVVAEFPAEWLHNLEMIQKKE